MVVTAPADAEPRAVARTRAEHMLYAKGGVPPGTTRLLAALAAAAAAAAHAPLLLRAVRVLRATLPHGAIASEAALPALELLPRFLVAAATPSSGAELDASAAAALVALSASLAGLSAAAASQAQLAVAMAGLGGECGAEADTGIAAAASVHAACAWAVRLQELGATTAFDDTVLDALALGAEAMAAAHDVDGSAHLDGAGTYAILVLPQAAAGLAWRAPDEPPCSAVLGTGRSAWIRCADAAPPAAVAAATAAAVCSLGGWSMPGPALGRLPLGPGGAATLSFALLIGGDGGDDAWGWDFQSAAKRWIEPLLGMLRPLGQLDAVSHVAVAAALPAAAAQQAAWDSGLQAWAMPHSATPFFIDSDWRLRSAAARSGRPVIHFIAFVPPQPLCPLRLLAPGDTATAANGFTVPAWGALAVSNPTDGCGNGTEPRRRRTVSPRELDRLCAVWVAQLRALLGLPPVPRAYSDGAGGALVAALPSAGGMSVWEVDLLLRRRATHDAAAARASLAALSRVVGAQSSMGVPPAVAALAHLALDAAARARSAAAAQAQATAAVEAGEATAAAEAAFFHPTILPQMYFPNDQKLAVFMPLLLPTALPLVMALLKEARPLPCRATPTLPGGPAAQATQCVCRFAIGESVLLFIHHAMWSNLAQERSARPLMRMMLKARPANSSFMR